LAAFAPRPHLDAIGGKTDIRAHRRARELSVSGTIATTAQTPQTPQTPHGRHISTMFARDNALYAKLEKALDG
jgi:hypothetical protein